MLMLLDSVTLTSVTTLLRMSSRIQNTGLSRILLPDQCSHRFGRERRRALQLFNFLRREIFQSRRGTRSGLFASVLRVKSGLWQRNVRGFVSYFRRITRIVEVVRRWKFLKFKRLLLQITNAWPPGQYFLYAAFIR